MLALTLAIVACTAAGAWSQRRYGERAVALTRRVLDLMLYVAIPLIVFFVLARADLTAGAGVGLALAYVAVAAIGLAAYALATRALRLDRRATATVVITAIMANSGFLGLPLVATLMGRDDLPAAVTFDVLVSAPLFFVVAFAIAAAMTGGAALGRAERWRPFVLRNPPLIAAVAALLAPPALTPDPLVDVAQVALIALAPVGFFVVGVHLAIEAGSGAMRVPPRMTKPVAAIVGLRLIAAPLLLLGLAAVVIDIPDAYLVQSAMPVGINALVVAHAYDLDRALAAAAIAWSTAIVLCAALAASVLL